MTFEEYQALKQPITDAIAEAVDKQNAERARLKELNIRYAAENAPFKVGTRATEQSHSRRTFEIVSAVFNGYGKSYSYEGRLIRQDGTPGEKVYDLYAPLAPSTTAPTTIETPQSNGETA